ncbi:MAG: preprotein translocase subunit SecG [Verrucomicrobia bacterium]|nr:preprotein translocase subunit SecG [Verrucomicrobiota bacterium]
MNWIGLFTNLLTAVNVLVCLLIVLLVLLQRPKDQGLGAAFGGDTASNIFGAQTTNVLATLTRWLGSIFLVLCLLIAVLGTHDTKRQGKITEYINLKKQEQAERDKEKATKEAAEAAKAASDAGKKPAVPAPSTSQPTPKPAEKPAETPAAPKPAETKPVEKPTEAKPVEKPADAKPAEPAATDPKPAEKPVDPKPAGGN